MSRLEAAPMLATSYRQDLQLHSLFSDGKNSILEMLRTAKEKGLDSVAITDHARGWESEGKVLEFFPNLETFSMYLSEIAEARNIFGDELKIFSGLEVETDSEGNFLLDPGIQAYRNANSGVLKLGVEVILGAIHSESIEEEYSRLNTHPRDRRRVLIQAMVSLIRNKEVDIIAHPFQALHGQFTSNLTEEEGEQILEAFREEWASGHSVFLELNGKRNVRYEQWEYDKYAANEIEKNDESFLRRYMAIGGKFSIGSDAHSISDILNPDLSIIERLQLTESDIHIFR
jgi:putative hydrolase